MGTHDAAEVSAVIYPLLGSSKAADNNYKEWLEYVLGHIHDYDKDYSKDLAELLPHNWKKQAPKKSETTPYVSVILEKISKTA